MRFKKPTANKLDKADKVIAQIAKAINGADRVKAGLPKESNPYPDGTSVVSVGAVHEFGRPDQNVPERSYLRSTLTNERAKYLQKIKELGKLILTGKIDGDKALAIMGLIMQTDIRETITTLSEPALVYREGNPLVDTGHLRQSITFKVGEK